MKKFNVLFTIFIIALTLYIASCDNKNMQNSISPTMQTYGVNDSCYEEYISHGGTCTNANFHCVSIWKNDIQKYSCEGYLRIFGYTCTSQYYDCTIPLSQTQICNEYGENVGPKVPYGTYTYLVCCPLGAGQKTVVVPTTDAKINLNMGCEYNIENENN